MILSIIISQGELVSTTINGGAYVLSGYVDLGYTV